MMYALLLLQVLLPLLLLLWLALRPLPSLAGRLVQMAAAGLYIASLHFVGMWLFPPWWTAHVLAVAWAVAALASFRTPPRLYLPSGLPEIGSAAALAAIGAYACWLSIDAMSGGSPTMEPVDLASPFRRGTYLVTSGGSSESINGHMRTLQPTTARMAAHRGQSYAVDLVKLDGRGMRAEGMRPRDPAKYRIFGEPVLAPCSGNIVAARNDMADLPVPEKDPVHLTGNHVLIDCSGTHVLLAHLKQGTVAVAPGVQVLVGEVIGAVGNSGNTDEPHLHIHAQRPGTASEPISGEPLQARIGGRFLVRGDRYSATRSDN